MSKANRDILFFPAGTTAVFHDGEQQPELQRAWLQVFADWLELMGRDPMDYQLHMPGGKRAQFFRTDDGRLNWQISE